MNTEQYRRAVDVFKEAIDQPPAERTAYVKHECGDDEVVCDRVMRMLKEDGDKDGALSEEDIDMASKVLEASAPDDSASPDSAGAIAGANCPDASPEYIGLYRILRKVAEGGMGVVYEAEQSNPKRTVALKVIRESWFTAGLRRRFAHEVRVLGCLDHPGIAHVYDAGTTEIGGRSVPFFAMEFVHGRSLIEYADVHDLTTRDRLELMMNICDAVHHAHQKGVVHRDLKPANILVTDHRRIKVLDFGVARAIDSDVQTLTMQTEPGQLVGTIPYMSPEQIRGAQSDLDIRSDVYALGVICFELLCGRLPHDVHNRSIPEAVRIISDDNPSSLGAIDRHFRGDIETIVSKALSKRPSERYQSAADFASDIKRYLQDEPIVARRPSTSYHLRKFAIRHKGLVAGIAMAFIALMLGTALTTWQAIVATRAREKAKAEEKTAAAINDFLIHEMLVADTPEERQGHEITLSDVLHNASNRVETALGDSPEVEAAVRHSLGEAFTALGHYDDAEAHLRAALEIRERILGSGHPDTLATISMLCRSLKKHGKIEEAAPLQVRVYETLRDTLGETDPEALDAKNNLGTLRATQGRFDEAAAIHREVLELRLRTCAADDPRPYYSMHNLAYALEHVGKLAESEGLYRRAIEGKERLEGPDHPSTLYSRINLNGVLRRRRKLDEAEASCRDTLRDCERVFGQHHIILSHVLRELALTLLDLGRPEGLPEARRTIEREIEIQEAALVPGSASLAESKGLLGHCLTRLGQFDEAEALLIESYEALLKAKSPANRAARGVRDWLVELFEASGNSEKAQTYRLEPPPSEGNRSN